MTNERRIAYNELLEIFKRLDPNLVSKIPSQIINYFEENKLPDYSFKYNDDLAITEQNISDTTKAILAALDLNYWCNNTQEQEALIDKYSKNTELYNDILQVSFDVETAFKHQASHPNQSDNVSDSKLVEYTPSVFKKFTNFILSLFRKNNK